MSASNQCTLTAIAAGTAIAVVSSLIGFYLGAHSPEVDSEIDEYWEDKEIPKGAQYKMVFAVRKDLRMGTGKIAAQCAHAAVSCYEKAIESTPNSVIEWKNQGQTKIASACPDIDVLESLARKAKRTGIVTTCIVDAGRTQIDPGSVTVFGIGPAPASKIDEITGSLRLL